LPIVKPGLGADNKCDGWSVNLATGALGGFRRGGEVARLGGTPPGAPARGVPAALKPMKTCAYCEAANDEHALACSNCGLELDPAPTAPPPAEGTDDHWVVLSSYPGTLEASIVAGRIRAAGIEVLMPEELGPSPYSTLPFGEVTLRVMEKDLEAARTVLATEAAPVPNP